MRLQLPNWLIDRIIARAMRTPYFDLPGYMSRWWIVPFRYKPDAEEGAGCGPVSFWRRPFAWGLQCFDVAIRVHQILRSDMERAYHDHPWPYITIILTGGYREERPVFNRSGIYVGSVSHWYGPGSVLFRRATHWHKLTLPEGESAWTLFITGPKRQGWGFLQHPDAKVYWRDYVKDEE